MSLVEDNNINILSETLNNISLSEKYCNICTENIENDKLVTLACNPNHYFCYTCIFDWYNTIKHNYSNSFGSSFDNKQCTCPICKKDGGVLPLLPPHINPIIGVHVKGAPSFAGFTLYGFGNNTNLFGGVAGSKCQHKDCNNEYSYMNLSSKPNNNGMKVYKSICSIHYYKYKKGENITLENDEIFESPYIQCNCKMPYNKHIKQCINTNMYNKMYSTTINNKKYYLCNDHTKLYNHGIQLTFNDDVIASKESTYKNICCFPNNKLKYGFCLNKLDNYGLCKKEIHNKNKQNIDLEDDTDIFGNSDSESEVKPKVINIHIGLCGATLKNGSGTCKNKGKSEYNGKCGKHKNC